MPDEKVTTIDHDRAKRIAEHNLAAMERGTYHQDATDLAQAYMEYRSVVRSLTARVVLLERVREAAEILVGPNNIGKTVDTNIYWDGAISAIMNGKALSAVMVTLAAAREVSK